MDFFLKGESSRCYGTSPGCCGDDFCGTDRTKWTCDHTCRRAKGFVQCDVYDRTSVGRRDCCRCWCFPSTARVNLENGNLVTMSELQIGDRVQTGTVMLIKSK